MDQTRVPPHLENDMSAGFPRSSRTHSKSCKASVGTGTGSSPWGRPGCRRRAGYQFPSRGHVDYGRGVLRPPPRGRGGLGRQRALGQALGRVPSASAVRPAVPVHRVRAHRAAGARGGGVHPAHDRVLRRLRSGPGRVRTAVSVSGWGWVALGGTVAFLLEVFIWQNFPRFRLVGDRHLPRDRPRLQRRVVGNARIRDPISPG